MNKIRCVRIFLSWLLCVSIELYIWELKWSIFFMLFSSFHPFSTVFSRHFSPFSFVRQNSGDDCNTIRDENIVKNFTRELWFRFEVFSIGKISHRIAFAVCSFCTNSPPLFIYLAEALGKAFNGMDMDRSTMITWYDKHANRLYADIEYKIPLWSIHCRNGPVNKLKS